MEELINNYNTINQLTIDLNNDLFKDKYDLETLINMANIYYQISVEQTLFIDKLKANEKEPSKIKEALKLAGILTTTLVLFPVGAYLIIKELNKLDKDIKNANGLYNLTKDALTLFNEIENEYNLLIRRILIYYFEENSKNLNEEEKDYLGYYAYHACLYIYSYVNNLPKEDLLIDQRTITFIGTLLQKDLQVDISDIEKLLAMYKNKLRVQDNNISRRRKIEQ